MNLRVFPLLLYVPQLVSVKIGCAVHFSQHTSSDDNALNLIAIKLAGINEGSY